MTTNAGWHKDPTDPTISRYWDGDRWNGEVHWDGSAWVEPQAAPAAAPAPALAPVAAPAHPNGAEATPGLAGRIAVGSLSRTTGFLLAGAGLAGIGVMLPWERVSSAYQSQVQTPSSIGGAAILLLGLVAIVAGVAWTSRLGRISARGLAGIVVAAAAMSFFVVAKFNAISGDQEMADKATQSMDATFGVGDLAKVTVEPGLGLFLWTVGVILIWVGIVRALRDRRT